VVSHCDYSLSLWLDLVSKILALPLAICVALGKPFHLSGPQLSSAEWVTVVSVAQPEGLRNPQEHLVLCGAWLMAYVVWWWVLFLFLFLQCWEWNWLCVLYEFVFPGLGS
jgi:hypothetical protein